MMSDEKLEGIKTGSSALFVIFLIGTIMAAFGEIDSIKTGEPSLLFFIIIFGMVTVGSLSAAIISSHKLKKRQGKKYWSTADYIQAFFEFTFPAMLQSKSIQQRKQNVSEKDKETKLWNDLCIGYDRGAVISFLLWCALWIELMRVVIAVARYEGQGKFLNLFFWSVMAISIFVIAAFNATRIKKNPSNLFDYIDLHKVKFAEIAEYYEKAEKIAYGIWIGEKFIFWLSKGQVYCIPTKEYENMEIFFSKWRFVMILRVQHDCVVQSAILPFKFYKAKKKIEEIRPDMEA